MMFKNKRSLDKILQLVQKPTRYTGGELGEVKKDPGKVDIRFAFCFPDSYEVGMSHLGMKILYSLINEREDSYCERVFAPWPDFEELLRKENIPLFALESKDPLTGFDFLGFTLQYELSYTNVLNMLDLANIPLYSKDRDESFPLVIAGGPCTVNSEPVADFFDLILIGEGEEATNELLDLYKKEKQSGYNKQSFLEKVSKIEGFYVPSLYDVSYNEDGTVAEIKAKSGAPEKIKRRVIKDFDKVYYPKSMVVPFGEAVHDRVMMEVLRGCIRGCRFCQAGFIYRPLREKGRETINMDAKTLCEATGYEEISLSSLSTSDYSDLNGLLGDMLDWTEKEKINLSLPSLRADNFTEEIRKKISSVRKSGLTFAPEAGSQRLRDAINKNLTESEIIGTCNIAFSGGYTAVKLYFMIGLPTETNEDIEAINDLALKVVNAYYGNPKKPKGKSVAVSVSAASFVPKPFTPFQWEPQDTVEMLEQKQKLLLDSRKTKKVSISYHNKNISILEAVLARGDRRLSRVIETAFRSGCKFDGWDEMFRFDKWQKAFDDCGIKMEFYANRKRSFDEVLPWDHIDIGIKKDFFIREAKRAYENKTTPNCREGCSACGLKCL